MSLNPATPKVSPQKMVNSARNVIDLSRATKKPKKFLKTAEPASPSPSRINQARSLGDKQPSPANPRTSWEQVESRG